jgi:hypothetical protein
MSRNSMKCCRAAVLVSSRQDDVVEIGDTGSGVCQCAGGAAVVTQDFEALHPGQGVFDLCSDGAVLLVQIGLPLGQFAAGWACGTG